MLGEREEEAIDDKSGCLPPIPSLIHPVQDRLSVDPEGENLLVANNDAWWSVGYLVPEGDPVFWLWSLPLPLAEQSAGMRWVVCGRQGNRYVVNIRNLIQ